MDTHGLMDLQADDAEAERAIAQMTPEERQELFALHRDWNRRRKMMMRRRWKVRAPSMQTCAAVSVVSIIVIILARVM